MLKQYDAIIIGAGASGMMAAITAKRRGRHILLIERNDQIGKKILVTGNGRCNISNKNVVQDYHKPVHYFGNNPKFVLSVLNQFGLEETLEFFHDLGVEFSEEDEGRLFPISNQAQSIVDVLLYEARELGIKIAKPNTVKNLDFDNDTQLFKLELNDGQEVETRKLVVATGGKSHHELGATDAGYEIATQFKHTITPTFPAYVALSVKSPLCHKLQGVKLEVKVKAFSNVADGQGQELIAENEGTLMFAHFGLSAPSVLEISGQIAYELEVRKRKVKLEINFLPSIGEHTDNNLQEIILDRWQKNPNKTLESSFIGVLPKKVFPAILEVNGIDGKIKVAEVTKELRQKIVKLLTQYEFDIDSIRGFDEAHFTAGGVDTKEVDPKTLGSKLQKGLYFCGEILDIDGECGGFNLQWAWSSGAVVGKNI